MHWITMTSLMILFLFNASTVISLRQLMNESFQGAKLSSNPYLQSSTDQKRFDAAKTGRFSSGSKEIPDTMKAQIFPDKNLAGDWTVHPQDWTGNPQDSWLTKATIWDTNDQSIPSKGKKNEKTSGDLNVATVWDSKGQKIPLSSSKKADPRLSDLNKATIWDENDMKIDFSNSPMGKKAPLHNLDFNSSSNQFGSIKVYRRLNV